MGLGRAAVGLVAGVGLVGAGYAGLGGQDNSTRDEAGQIVEAGEVGAFRIRVGDCFNAEAADEIESVAGVPCSQPHDGEAYYAFFLPEGDGSYPGEDAVLEQAIERCLDQFVPFVGHDYQTSELDFWPMYPTEGSWDHLDDREVLCVLANYDGTKKVGAGENAGV